MLNHHQQQSESRSANLLPEPSTELQTLLDSKLQIWEDQNAGDASTHQLVPSAQISTLPVIENGLPPRSRESRRLSGEGSCRMSGELARQQGCDQTLKDDVAADGATEGQSDAGSPPRRSPIRRRSSSLKRQKKSRNMYPLHAYLQELGANVKPMKAASRTSSTSSLSNSINNCLSKSI